MTYQNTSIRTESEWQQKRAARRWGEYCLWSDDIPRELAPSAKGLFVASPTMTERTERHRKKRPSGWFKPPSGTSRIMYGKRYSQSRMNVLGGRYCTVKRYGDWWTVERCVLGMYEVLVFSLGPLLIVTSSRDAAMQLADCCSPHAPDALSFLSWEDVTRAR
jgi:hypothetical protein